MSSCRFGPNNAVPPNQEIRHRSGKFEFPAKRQTANQKIPQFRLLDAVLFSWSQEASPQTDEWGDIPMGQGLGPPTKDQHAGCVYQRTFSTSSNGENTYASQLVFNISCSSPRTCADVYSRQCFLSEVLFQHFGRRLELSDCIDSESWIQSIPNLEHDST